MNKYITTPIYYPNDKPHVGHAATTIVCDVLKKSFTLQGYKVKTSTGLDEHGQKMQTILDSLGGQAMKKSYLDGKTAEFTSLFARLGIDYDIFIKTTDANHIENVTNILQKFYDEGKFFKKNSEGMYCVGCEQFKQKDDLDENGCCPDHKTKPVYYSEENWYFKLDNSREWLLDLLGKENFINDPYKKEMINLVKDGIPDLCISRPIERVWHGIPLPFDKKYVTYVWFDALINYITAIGFDCKKEKQSIEFNNYWNNSIHLLAKDIVKPHSIFWTIMLHELGVNAPKHEFIHGYLVGEGGVKMSKSLGNGVDPNKLVDIFGCDAIRWTLTKIINKNDAELSYKSVFDIFNNDLANTIGNGFFRMYTLAQKTFDGGAIPKANFSAAQKAHLKAVCESLKNILPAGTHIDQTSMYAKNVLEQFRNLNLFIDQEKPWTISDITQKQQSLLCILEHTAMLFNITYPIMPGTSKYVLDLLGEKFDGNEKLELTPWGLPVGVVLKPAVPLFQRKKEDEISQIK